MAESKITLTLGGKYTAGDAFSKWNTDVKDVEKSTKDMTDAARKSAGALVGLFEGELNGTIKTTYNLLGDIARGGLWGALAGVANLTIGFIVDKINEAAHGHNTDGPRFGVRVGSWILVFWKRRAGEIATLPLYHKATN